MAVYSMYCVRDNKVGYGAPYVQVNNQSAERDFSYRLHNNDVLGFSPNDFSLYKVGEFETESGKVTPIDPEFICEGSSLF